MSYPAFGPAFGAVSVLAQSGVAVSTTSATEVNLASVKIPGGAMGKNGALLVTALFSCTASTNVKTPRLRYSATSGDVSGGFSPVAISSASTTATFTVANYIRNTNAVNAQAAHNGAEFSGAIINGVVSGSINTSQDWYVNINGAVAGGETLALLGYTVELRPAG